MSAKEEKPHIERKSHIRENITYESDERVKMIYERYHTGRAIIMDDLEYLLLKNPEAFEKIARSILRPKSEKGFNFGSIDIGNSTYVKKSVESETEQQNIIDYTSSEGMPSETVVNVSDIMTSLKSIIEHMSEKELQDISQNIYDPLELIKRIAVLNDISPDEKVLYTYAKDKDFDISV